MFQVNDVVVHYRDGVSVITDTVMMGDCEYFTIRAKRVGDVSIYVPVLNAINIIRKVMTTDEALKLIEYMNNLPELYIANTKQRRDEFKRRLASSDIKDVIYLCKLLYLYKTMSELPDGVKFGPMDVEMLYDAHNRLIDELCVVYSKEKDDIEEFLVNRVKSFN